MILKCILTVLLTPFIALAFFAIVGGLAYYACLVMNLVGWLFTRNDEHLYYVGLKKQLESIFIKDLETLS